MKKTAKASWMSFSLRHLSVLNDCQQNRKKCFEKQNENHEWHPQDSYKVARFFFVAESLELAKRRYGKKKESTNKQLELFFKYFHLLPRTTTWSVSSLEKRSH